MLIPVNTTCWEATVLASYYVAKTRNVMPLIALRAGYMNPTLAARMFATLDQMSGGRLCINLIAGLNDDDAAADGVFDNKIVRYEKMGEEVEIMKRLWSSNEPIGFEGTHYRSPIRRSSSAAARRKPPRFRRSTRPSISSGAISRP
jgi:alkanesulfonate monooxygenase